MTYIMTENEIVTLYTFKDIVEATMALDALKESGIEAFLIDTTTSGIRPMTGVELKVFFKDVGAAEKIIEEYKDKQ